jgi:hypothetical protein
VKLKEPNNHIIPTSFEKTLVLVGKTRPFSRSWPHRNLFVAGLDLFKAKMKLFFRENAESVHLNKCAFPSSMRRHRANSSCLWAPLPTVFLLNKLAEQYAALETEFTCACQCQYSQLCLNPYPSVEPTAYGLL